MVYLLSSSGLFAFLSTDTFLETITFTDYLIGFSLHAKRAPVIDPEARLGESDGKPLLWLAIELIAVAPESRIAQGVNHL
jgi:hypothetical protein